MSPMGMSNRGASGTAQGNNMTGSNRRNRGDKIPEGYEMGQIQRFTPEQMSLMQQMMGHVSPDSYLSRLAGGDQSMYAEMEAPAMRQFQEQLGQLGSRFSGMGMGAQRGSGFQNQATQATSDFAQDLASRRMDMRNQAIKDLMGMSGELLGQRPYEKFMTQKAPEEEGLDWLGLGGSALGGIAGAFAGGPAGALTGAGLGYNMLGRKGSGASGNDISNFSKLFSGNSGGGSQSGFFTGPSEGKNFVQF